MYGKFSGSAQVQCHPLSSTAARNARALVHNYAVDAHAVGTLVRHTIDAPPAWNGLCDTHAMKLSKSENGTPGGLVYLVDTQAAPALVVSTTLAVPA